MKRFFFAVLGILPLLGTASLGSGYKEDGLLMRNSEPIEDQAFALIELFTSQGCSSCPSADKLVQKLADQPRVFVMAYHVDYWDHLGWKDPYSLKESTQRQKWYNKDLQLGTTYTPQAVVNGTTECVGSNKTKLQELIKGAFSAPVKARIHLELQNAASSGKYTLQYRLSGQWKGAQLLAAVLENGIKTEIKRGENAGKKLPYAHIVRSLQTVKPVQQESGSLSIALPEQSGPGSTYEVIVFLQKIQSGEIYALARADL
jgi:hypothetical protein